MKKTGVTETGTGSNDSTATRIGRAAMAEKARVKVVNGASSRSCRSAAGKAETSGIPRRLCVMWLTAETREAEINGVATEVNTKIQQVKNSILRKGYFGCLNCTYKEKKCNFFSLLFPAAKYKSNTNPPPLPKSALTEEEVARKSAAIIEEYLHINDLKVHFAKHKSTSFKIHLKCPVHWLFFFPIWFCRRHCSAWRNSTASRYFTCLCDTVSSRRSSAGL